MYWGFGGRGSPGRCPFSRHKSHAAFRCALRTGTPTILPFSLPPAIHRAWLSELFSCNAVFPMISSQARPIPPRPHLVLLLETCNGEISNINIILNCVQKVWAVAPLPLLNVHTSLNGAHACPQHPGTNQTVTCTNACLYMDTIPFHQMSQGSI